MIFWVTIGESWISNYNYSLKLTRLIGSSSNSLKPVYINAIGFVVASFNYNGPIIGL
jgi:hypothetical protein